MSESTHLRFDAARPLPCRDDRAQFRRAERLARARRDRRRGHRTYLALALPDDVRLLPGEAQLVDECVRAGQDVPDPASWRPGARIDTDAEHGFLVIRTTEYAAVCIIDKGKGTGILGGVSTNHVYSKLTATRPFDYLSSWNDETGSIHFGITTGNVTSVSLAGPDQSVTPTVLRNGTFLAKTKFPEGSGQSTTNHIRATLSNGQPVEGPFR